MSHGGMGWGMSALANAVRENLPKDMMRNWGQWMKRYFKYCRRSWHCISKARSIPAHTKHKQSKGRKKKNKGRRNDVNSFRTRFEARKFISKLMTQHRVGAETILDVWPEMNWEHSRPRPVALCPDAILFYWFWVWQQQDLRSKQLQVRG